MHIPNIPLYDMYTAIFYARRSAFLAKFRPGSSF